MFCDNFAIYLILPTALEQPYCTVKNVAPMAATRAVAMGWPAALMVDCESTSESYVVRHISSKDFFERFWKIYRNKLQLDWLSATSTRTINSRKSVRATTDRMRNPRTPLESSQRGEFKSSLAIFM